MGDSLEAKAVKIIPGRVNGSVITEDPQKETATFGKNEWIFCTSIEPTNQEENDKWRKAMPKKYDHKSYIYRPRQFARSLGSMVAEQLGPQGREEEMKHTFDGKRTITKHKTQLIIHGPVIYEEEPHDVIFREPESFKFIVRSIFIKRLQYEDEREYRFVVLTEKEPSTRAPVLDVSLEMLGSMQKFRGKSIPQVLPAIIPSEESSESHAMLTDPDHLSSSEESEQPRFRDPPQTESSLNSMIMDAIYNPSSPITPHALQANDLPPDFHEKMTACSILKALQDRIETSARVGKLDDKRYVEVTSSAWHAEQLIRRLCSTFEDPVREVSIDKNNFIILRIKFSDESRRKGRVEVDPQGITFVLETNGIKIRYHSKRDRLVGGSVVEELKEAGLRLR